MQDYRMGRRVEIPAGRIFLAVTAVVVSSTSLLADDALQFEHRRQAAQAALEERMKARVAAGWVPKSFEEQMVTRLQAIQRRDLLSQDKAARRAAFEAARGEVYQQMAKHYTTVGYYRRGYAYSYTSSRVYGGYRPVVRSYDYWVLDPWAARLSSHFANKAARSKGISVAQEYHANTYYARRLQNTSSRISELQRTIALNAQIARGP